MMKRIFLMAWISATVAAYAWGGPITTDQHSIDPQAVLNRTWQWVATVTPVEMITVPDPERYTLHFGEKGKLEARFDCNRGGGDYTLGEGTLSFGPLLSTRMACPPDSLDSRFMRDLQRVKSFFVEGDALYLELPYDSGTMRFRTP